MTSLARHVILALSFFIACAANAQDWPARPIKLIVPTGAGHAVDIMARQIAQGASPGLGQPMYVENMPGASGFIGAQATARATPDGYTLLFAPASVMSSNLYMFKSLPYDPRQDFAAVAMVVDKGPIVVSVNPELPIKSIAELIAYGKANPSKLSYAVDASGGLAIVTGKLLNKRGGIGMVEVPYRSSPQMAQDTVAGTVQLMVSSIPPVAGLEKAGKLRWLGVSSEQRFPGLENLPTINETLPGFHLDGWFVVVAPTGTPTAVVERLNREISKVLQSPELRTQALQSGIGISDPQSPAATAAFIKAEQERWKALVQELGIEPQ
jgi:tripartite-type tricarboxylate transporter receptor subunit TctC